MLNLLRSRNPVSEETFLERLRGVLKSWRKSGFLKIRSVTALAGGLRYFPLQMPYIRRGVAFVYLAARWIIFDEKLRRWQVDEHSGRACTPFCSFRRFHVSSRVFSSGNCQKKKERKKNGADLALDDRRGKRRRVGLVPLGFGSFGSRVFTRDGREKFHGTSSSL